jgi:hypothetical protein
MTYEEEVTLKTLTDRLKDLGALEQTATTMYEIESTALEALAIVRKDEGTRAVVWYGLPNSA